MPGGGQLKIKNQQQNLKIFAFNTSSPKGSPDAVLIHQMSLKVDPSHTNCMKTHPLGHLPSDAV